MVEVRVNGLSATLQGVGMRWSEDGFNHLLHLRAWVNQRFDNLFSESLVLTLYSPTARYALRTSCLRQKQAYVKQMVLRRFKTKQSCCLEQKKQNQQWQLQQICKDKLIQLKLNLQRDNLQYPRTS